MSEIKHPTFTITLENGGEMKGELYPEIAPSPWAILWRWPTVASMTG